MIYRRKMAAANWKMNLTVKEGMILTREIMEGLPSPLECDVVIAPPFPHLVSMVEEVGNSGIQVAAQNCYHEKSGAYTGEVSISMLSELGARYIIVGHSERREIFGEPDAIIKSKVDMVLEAGLTPIFCCGESLQTREAGNQAEFVLSQLQNGIFHLNSEQLSRVIIAYEPVWAIGTGITATPEQAQDMHAFIRQAINDAYGHTVSDHIRILYGGSIKADNARLLFSQRDVDGGLVGGASLQGPGFLAIIAAACG